jgi:hypothetical protein
MTQEVVKPQEALRMLADIALQAASLLAAKHVDP